MVIPNPTKYFDPARSKDFLKVPDSNSFYAKRSKIEDYETRLYYEYEETKRKGGQTFFYTLTYNNRSLPRFHGYPCFNYDDVRYLTTGGFVKKLERDYNYKLRYCITCELGEGKGKRGYHNNPHYHCLFFLTPISYPAIPIKATTFRSLVRQYWQGAEYIRYEKAKFGVCKPGKFDLGEVNSFRACSYVAKYVAKDVGISKIEFFLKNDLEKKFFDDYENTDRSKLDFLRSAEIDIDSYYQEKTNNQPNLKLWFSPGELDLAKWYANINTLQYRYFLVQKSKEYVQEQLKIFRNLHSGKVRISQGVGKYALSKLTSDYKVPFPSKSGFKYRPLGMYYYRKLFYGQYKRDGNVYYFLNSKGIEYKCLKLKENLNNIAKDLVITLNFISNYDNFKSWSKTFKFGYNVDDSSLNLLRNKIFDCFADEDNKMRYCRYKAVFEGRSFNRGVSPFVADSNVSEYYRDFLVPGLKAVSNSSDSFNYRRFFSSKTFIPWFHHSYFSGISDILPFISSITDFVRKSNEAEAERQYNERERLRKQLNELSLTLV